MFSVLVLGRSLHYRKWRALTTLTLGTATLRAAHLIPYVCVCKAAPQASETRSLNGDTALPVATCC